MTETIPMTSAENSGLIRHKTLHPQAINKTKTVYCHNKLLPRHCKVEIHAPTNQTFKRFEMHAEFNIFLDQKVPECKIFISTIQTLSLSLHCTCPKLSCFMEVNKEEFSIRILQGTNNTDGMFPMRQTALQVYVILTWICSLGIVLW